MTHTYFKGYKVVYDYDKQDWFYEDTGESATKNPKRCRQCGHHPIKDGELECDYCLGNLGSNVVSACCGHGVKQDAFILFKDGRRFVEEKRLKETEKFKDCLIEFDKAKQSLKENKRKFKYNVIEFMKNKGIPIKILFFGDTFGLDIDININNVGNVPRKIPLDVLTDFCKEFGCEFEYTRRDGRRYIFSFNGLSMGY